MSKSNRRRPARPAALAPIAIPQDHKPAEDAPYDFTFTAPGVDDKGEPVTKTYHLADPSEAATRIPGRYVRAVMLNPKDEVAQTALGFALLDASDTDPAVIDVLMDLPISKVTDVMAEWMSDKGPLPPH